MDMRQKSIIADSIMMLTFHTKFKSKFCGDQKEVAATTMLVWQLKHMHMQIALNRILNHCSHWLMTIFTTHWGGKHLRSFAFPRFLPTWNDLEPWHKMIIGLKPDSPLCRQTQKRDASNSQVPPQVIPLSGLKNTHRHVCVQWVFKKLC